MSPLKLSRLQINVLFFAVTMSAKGFINFVSPRRPRSASYGQSPIGGIAEGGEGLDPERRRRRQAAGGQHGSLLRGNTDDS